MNDDPILRRLRGLAQAPVDEAVAERHLNALAVLDTGPAPVRRSRYVVLGGVVAGTLLAGTTLAGAVTGRLPDAAQNVAHNALAKVNVDVPRGDEKASKADGPGNVERFLGDATTSCTNPDGSPFVGNHGQYVKAHPDDPATADVNERQVAAESRCGKPVQAGTGDGDGDGAGAEVEANDHDTGKPEGAGKPDDAGKPEGVGNGKPDDTGKPDDAGKPDGTGKPEGVPRANGHED